MSSFTANFNLGLVFAQGSDNVTKVNEDLAALDVIAAGRVKNRTNDTPPGSVSAGDAFIVAADASGAWFGLDGQVAWWNGSEWRYFNAPEGYCVRCLDEQCHLVRTAGGWFAQSLAAEVSLRKTTASSAFTTDAAVDWDQSMIDVSLSQVFEYDGSNPSRVRILETGDYEFCGRVTFTASGTSVWNPVRVRLQTSTDGSSWSDAAESESRCSIHPTDVPNCSAPIHATVNLVGATALADSFVRAVVDRVAGSSTCVVSSSSSLRIRKIR